MNGDIKDFGGRDTKSLSAILNRNRAEPPSYYSEDEPRPTRLTQWSILKANQYLAAGPSAPKLPAGLYTAEDSQIGLLFNQRPIQVDDMLRFPDSLVESVLHEVNEFWNHAQVFNDYGFLHRRGYLLYGPQGGGKTVIIQLLIADIIKRDGLVFQGNMHPQLLDKVLRTLREVENTRPLVCIFEDIDAIIAEYGEAELLSVLDGENQVNTVINLASTNFPENLPKRIVSRPRRFDRVIRVDYPPAGVRKIYFQEKLKIEAHEVERWVEVSEGWSFAACAELVISVKCLGNDFDETVTKLESLRASKFSSEEFDHRSVGFGGQE